MKKKQFKVMGSNTKFEYQFVFPSAFLTGFQCVRSNGTKVPLLSANTLHIVDKILCMLPFITQQDLNAAAIRTDVSNETRNTFLNKLLA